MTVALFGFPGAEAAPAARLAVALGVPARAVAVRQFPDGESLVRVAEPAETAILYRSLDRPNAKLVELLLAASALRDGGTRRLILVAPYLAYMRQDMAFHAGEAVSQRVIGTLLAQHCDAVVTVDPHLHRVASLDEVVPGRRAVTVSAAPLLTDLLRADLSPDTLLIGPDAESRPWVEGVAAPLGLEVLVGEKLREGDRAVRLAIPGIERVAGRPVVLIDDVIASGQTLIRCAELLLAAGATRVEALATHCLASPADMARMTAAGIARVRATDCVDHPWAVTPIAPLLAEAIRAAALLDG